MAAEYVTLHGAQNVVVLEQHMHLLPGQLLVSTLLVQTTPSCRFFKIVLHGNNVPCFVNQHHW